MKESDLEPFRDLVSEIQRARMRAFFGGDKAGNPVDQEPTVDTLLGELFYLHLRARKAYDDLAAKVDGARSYGETIEPGAPS